MENIREELKKLENWEIREIINTLDRNASWRAETLYLENFPGADEINKLELEYAKGDNKYILAKFLLEAFKKQQYYIVEFRMRFFGDEGGPTCEFTLVTRDYDIGEDQFNEAILLSTDIRYKIYLIPI